MFTSNAEHTGQKLSESDPERNFSVIEVMVGSFDLWNAATASFREKLYKQKTRNQTHQRWHEDVAEIGRRYSKRRYALYLDC